MKLSFKKEPKETGLSAIGNSYPRTKIKIDGKIIGEIVPPNWQSVHDVWVVRFTINKKDINEDGNPNCSWRWVQLKSKFNNEESAREFLKENKDKIFGNFDLHYSE
jgi:hypothetical protein